MVAEQASGCAGACCSSACLGGAKAGLALVLTLEGAACAALVPWLGRYAKLRLLANAFAAGVFIATALVHTLPHAAEVFAGGPGGGGGGPAEAFPTTNVIALAALLAFTFLETVVLGKFSHGSHAHASCCHNGAPGGEEDVEDDAAVGDSDCIPAAAAKVPAGDAEAGGDVCGAAVGPFFSAALCAAAVPVLAVAIHSLLESISLGLAPELAAALPLFGAIAAHRGLEATAVLAKLAAARGLHGTQRGALFAAFVLIAPVGVAAGVALSGMPGKVEGVLAAAAGGAFLYLGLEGLLAEILPRGEWRWRKFCALLVGAGLVVVVNGVLFAAGVES
jgi:ZIP Zinc transporter